MKNINKLYKDGFDNLELSEDRKEDILNGIYRDFNKYKKIKISVISLLLILFTGITYIGVTRADEIIEYFKVKTVKCDNGEATIGRAKSERLVINYDANLPEHELSEKPISFSYDEIEKLLNIKLVKNKKFDNEKIHLSYLKKENNEIASVRLDIPFSKTNRYHLSMSFITKYHIGNDVIEWNTKTNRQANEYTLKNLNTKAYVLQFAGEPWTSSIYNVIFIYEGITYYSTFTIHERTPEKRKEAVMEVLDSFYI